MKKTIPFFLAVAVLSLITTTTYAQSPKSLKSGAQRPTNLSTDAKPLPAPASIDEIIISLEERLQKMLNRPGQYSSKQFEEIQQKLETYCQERDNPTSAPMIVEVPGGKPEWIQITQEEADNLPKETERKIKASLDVKSGARSVRIYKKNPENN